MSTMHNLATRLSSYHAGMSPSMSSKPKVIKSKSKVLRGLGVILEF